VVRKRGGIKKVEEGSGSGKKKKVAWIEEFGAVRTGAITSWSSSHDNGTRYIFPFGNVQTTPQVLSLFVRLDLTLLFVFDSSFNSNKRHPLFAPSSQQAHLTRTNMISLTEVPT
jgi:hypothetical protein